MTPEIGLLLALLAASVAAGFGFTLVGRALAIRLGAVAHPQRDRWSVTAVPLLGGPAIVVTTAAVLAFVPGLPVSFWVLFGGAAALAAVGLVDDLRPITPYTKLAAQLAAAGAVTALGLRFPLTGVPVFDIIVTVVWLVGLSNAFNLLDNMDGLAAGIAAIAGGVKIVLFAAEGDWSAAWATSVLVGACLGFLALNFHPARIFMGDSGSLFIGFFVAGLSTIGGTPDSRATASVLIGPVAVMLVPIFDTVLVTIMRIIAGRPISQGGRDHASHRLVTAGLSVRRAVLVLYGLAAAAGVVGIVTRSASRGVGLTLFAALGVALLLLGVTLARIRIYPADTNAPARGFRLHHPPTISFVRQFATAAIDGLLVLASFYGAAAFQQIDVDRPDSAVVRALPLVISAKMIALAIFRVNNRVWRYTSSRDLLAIAQASTVGSALALLVVASAHGLFPAAQSLFVLDWILMTSLLAGSRLSLRALAESLKAAPTSVTRVLIYGAGDAGVALLQEIRGNAALARRVVAFLDDDPLMQRTRVQGLTVLGGIGALEAVLGALKIDEVIVATSKLPAARFEDIRAACAANDVRLSRFRLSIEGLGGVAQIRQIRER